MVICLVFRKTKDLYLIITQKLIILKSGGFHADFTWNPADFMKSLVIASTLHSSNWRVFAETLAFIRFWVDFTWNPLDFTGEIQKSRWNPPDFTGEICQISWVKSGWNPLDFTGEICRISRVKSGWNPPDFERQLPGMVSPMFVLFVLLCIVCRSDPTNKIKNSYFWNVSCF